MASLVNEAVVHGFDAANAAGRQADVDPDVAAALAAQLVLTKRRGWYPCGRWCPSSRAQRCEATGTGHRR